jgi:hypothetical protein
MTVPAHTIRRRLGAALVFVVLATARIASAQTNAADSASAEALYDEALRLMEQKQYADACPKLEESQRLDPGVGTLLYLGHCYEKLGKLASAWATFKDAAYTASSSGQKDREQVAQERADAIKPNLSYITLRVAEPDMPGLEVLRDGQLVRQAAWGVPVPIDPGEHRIQARRPNAEPWSALVKIAPGPGSIQVDVPRLAEAHVAPPAAPAPAPAVTAAQRVSSAPKPPKQQSAKQPSARQPRAHADSNAGGAQRTWAWVTLGAGGAGLVVGGVFALLAKKADAEANKNCRPDDPTLCNSDGVTLGDTAVARGQAAGVATGLGAALAVTGGVLLWTAPSAQRTSEDEVSVSAELGPRLAGLRLGGTW